MVGARREETIAPHNLQVRYAFEADFPSAPIEWPEPELLFSNLTVRFDTVEGDANP